MFNPIYYWVDSFANTYSGQTINNLPAGWYYFTITDDVCQASDSVYVDVVDEPIADFIVDIASGCDPLTVTFINESTNGVSFEWDFGNGPVTVGTSGNQTFTFNTSSTVTLVATDQYGCESNLASGWIEVFTCGCTDVTALNYDPSAQADDGSLSLIHI